MQSTTKRIGKMTHGLTDATYIDLLQSFPPRPIKSEEEMIATQKVIDALIDRGQLTPEEDDYLNVLGALVNEYEQNQITIPDISGVELLQTLLEDFNLRQKDLVAIFKTESIVSDILKGRRKLTTDHIQRLAEFFHISPAAFFPSKTS